MTSKVSSSFLPLPCANSKRDAGTPSEQPFPSCCSSYPRRLERSTHLECGKASKVPSLTPRDVQVLLNHTQSVILAIRSRGNVSSAPSSRLIIPHKGVTAPYCYFFSPHANVRGDGCGSTHQWWYRESIHDGSRSHTTPTPPPPLTFTNNSAGNGRNASGIGGGSSAWTGILPRTLLVLEALQRQLFHLSSYTLVGIPTQPSPHVEPFQLYYDDIVENTSERTHYGSSCDPEEGEHGGAGNENGRSAPVDAFFSLGSSTAVPAGSAPFSSCFPNQSTHENSFSFGGSATQGACTTCVPSITDWAVRSYSASVPTSAPSSIPGVPPCVGPLRCRMNREDPPAAERRDGYSVDAPRDAMEALEETNSLPSRRGILSQDAGPHLFLLPFCVVCEYPFAGMACPAVAFSALISIVESRCSFVTVEGLKLILQTCLTATKSGCMHAEVVRIMNDPSHRPPISVLFDVKKSTTSVLLTADSTSGRKEKTSPKDSSHSSRCATEGDGAKRRSPSHTASLSPPLPFSPSPCATPYPISATTMLFGRGVLPSGTDQLTGAGGGSSYSLSNHSNTDGTPIGATNGTNSSGGGYRGNSGGEADQKYQELLWSRVAGTYAACFEHPAACELEECWYIDAARSLLCLPSFDVVSSWVKSSSLSSSAGATTTGGGSNGFGSFPFSSTGGAGASSSRTPLMNSVMEGALKRVVAALFSRVVDQETVSRNKWKEENGVLSRVERREDKGESHLACCSPHHQKEDRPSIAVRGETARVEGLNPSSPRWVSDTVRDRDAGPYASGVNGALMIQFISALIMGPHICRETPVARRRRVTPTTTYSHYRPTFCPFPFAGTPSCTSQERQFIWKDLLYLIRMQVAMASDPALFPTPSHPATLQLEGLFLAQHALLHIPKDLLCTSPAFRPLLYVIQNELSRSLLVAGMHTRYPVVLSLVLRTTHLLIQLASEALVPQIYFFLRALHFSALSSSEDPGMTGLMSTSSPASPVQYGEVSIPPFSPSTSGVGQNFHRVSSSLSSFPMLSVQERQERRDIILESLAYLCAQGDFCRYCYTHYDLSSSYPAVLPQLCDVLLQQVFEPAVPTGGGGSASANGGSSDGAGNAVGSGATPFTWNLNASPDTALQAMQVAANFLATLNEVYSPSPMIGKELCQAAAMASLRAKVEERQRTGVGVVPPYHRRKKETTDIALPSVVGGGDLSTFASRLPFMREGERERGWQSHMRDAVRMDQAIQWTFKQKNLLIQFANLFAESPIKKGIPFLLQMAARVPSSVLAAQKRQQRAANWKEKDRNYLDMEWDQEAMDLLETGLESTWLVLAEPAGGREVGECLFRLCPLLDKRALGEYLGEQGDYLTIRPEDDVLVELPSGASIPATELWDAQREQASLEFGTASFFAAQLHGFISQFRFAGRSLLEAIRELVYRVCLPGESQKIDRIMEIFSWYWYESNPPEVDPSLNPFGSDTTAFILSFATIMLNTDLHSGKMHQPMTLQEFKNMNRQVDEGKEVPEEYLRELYEDVKLHEVIMPDMMYKTFLNDVTWDLEMDWNTIEVVAGERVGGTGECDSHGEARDQKRQGEDSMRDGVHHALPREKIQKPSLIKVSHKPLRVNFWNVLERWPQSWEEEETTAVKEEREEQEERARHGEPEKNENSEGVDPTPGEVARMHTYDSALLPPGVCSKEFKGESRRSLVEMREGRRRGVEQDNSRQEYVQEESERVFSTLWLTGSLQLQRSVSLLDPLSQQVLSRYAFVALWRRTLLLFTGIIRGISANGLRGSTSISGGSIQACLDQLRQSGPVELSALLTGLRGCCVVMTTALKLVPEMVDYSYSCLAEVLWWMTDPSAYESGGKKGPTSGGGTSTNSNSHGSSGVGSSVLNGMGNSTSSLLSGATGCGGGIGRSTSLLGDNIALSKHVPCLLCLRELFALLPLVSPYLWRSWSGIAKVILELFVTGVMPITSLSQDAYFWRVESSFSSSVTPGVSCSFSPGSLLDLGTQVSDTGFPQNAPEPEGSKEGRDSSLFPYRHALTETLYGHPLVWSSSILSSLSCSDSGVKATKRGDTATSTREKTEKQSTPALHSTTNDGGGGGGGKWFSGLRNYASQSKRLRDLDYQQEQAQAWSRVRQCVPNVRVLLDMAMHMPANAHLQWVNALCACSVPQQLKDASEVQRFGYVCSFLSAIVTDRIQNEALCLFGVHRARTVGGSGRGGSRDASRLCRTSMRDGQHCHEGSSPVDDPSPPPPRSSSPTESSIGDLSCTPSPSFNTLQLLQSYQAFVVAAIPLLCHAVRRKFPSDEKSLKSLLSMSFGVRQDKRSADSATSRISTTTTTSTCRQSSRSSSVSNPPSTTSRNGTPSLDDTSPQGETKRDDSKACSPPRPQEARMETCGMFQAYQMPLSSEGVSPDSPVIWVRSLSRSVCGILSVLKEMLQQWLAVARGVTPSRRSERERKKQKDTRSKEPAVTTASAVEMGEEEKEEEIKKRRQDEEEERQRLQLVESLLACVAQVPRELSVPVVLTPLMEMLSHFLLYNYDVEEEDERRKHHTTPYSTPDTNPHSHIGGNKKAATPNSVDERQGDGAEGDADRNHTHPHDPMTFHWNVSLPSPLASSPLGTRGAASTELEATIVEKGGTTTARAAPIRCLLGCTSWQHRTVNPVLRVLVRCVQQFHEVLDDDVARHAIGVVLASIAQQGWYDVQCTTSIEEIIEVALRIGMPLSTAPRRPPTTPTVPSSHFTGGDVQRLEEMVWERSSRETTPCDPSYPCIALLHCSHTLLSHMRITLAQECVDVTHATGPGVVDDALSSGSPGAFSPSRVASSTSPLVSHHVVDAASAACTGSPPAHAGHSLSSSLWTLQVPMPAGKQEAEEEVQGMEREAHDPTTCLALPLFSHWAYYWMLCVQSLTALAMHGERGALSPVYAHTRRLLLGSSSSSTITSTRLMLPSREGVSPTPSGSSPKASEPRPPPFPVFHRLSGGAVEPHSHTLGRASRHNGEETLETEKGERGAPQLMEGERREDAVLALSCVEYCLTDVMNVFHASFMEYFTQEGEGREKSEREDHRDDALLEQEFIPGRTSTPLPPWRTSVGSGHPMLDPYPTATATPSPSPVPWSSAAWYRRFWCSVSIVSALYHEVLFPMADGWCSDTTHSSLAHFPPSSFRPLPRPTSAGTTFCMTSASAVSGEYPSLSSIPQSTVVSHTNTSVPATRRGEHPPLPSLHSSSSFSPSLSPVEDLLHRVLSPRNGVGLPPPPTALAYLIQLLPLLWIRVLSPFSVLTSLPGITAKETASLVFLHSFITPRNTMGETADHAMPSAMPPTVPGVDVAPSSGASPSPASLARLTEEGESVNADPDRSQERRGHALPPSTTLHPSPSFPFSSVQQTRALRGDEVVLPMVFPVSDGTERRREGEGIPFGNTQKEHPLFLSLPFDRRQGTLSNDLFNIWKQLLTTLHRFQSLQMDHPQPHAYGTTRRGSLSFFSSSPSSVSSSSSSVAVLQSIDESILSMLVLVDGLSEGIAVAPSSAASCTAAADAGFPTNEEGSTSPFLLPTETTTKGILQTAYFAGALLTSRVEFWPITLEMMSMFPSSSERLKQLFGRHQNALERVPISTM